MTSQKPQNAFFESFIRGDVVVSKDSNDKSEQNKKFKSFESDGIIVNMNSSNNSEQIVLEHDHEKDELKTVKIFHDAEKFRFYVSNKIQNVKKDSVKLSEDICFEINTVNDILCNIEIEGSFNRSEANKNATQSQTGTSKDINPSYVKFTNN